MRHVDIQNHTTPLATPIRAGYCSSFLSRFRGLMFQKSIRPGEGILLVEGIESKVNTTIHMLFMNFDIAVVWIDSARKVVDVQLARRWRLYYAPAAAARYVLELHPDRLVDFKPGDQLEIVHA